MKKSNRVLGLTLALLISAGIISGCSTQLANIATPGVAVSGTLNLEGSATAVQVQDSLISIHDDETTYSDSENILNSSVDSAFGIKAVETPVSASPTPKPSISAPASESPKPSISASVPPTPKPSLSPLPPTAKPSLSASSPPRPAVSLPPQASDTAKAKISELQAKLDEAKAKLQEKAELAKQNAAKMKEQLEKSGAVKVNTDGTVKVDPSKLKEEVNKALEKEKHEMEKRVEEAKGKLEAKKEVAKQELEQVKRKNNVVRKSEVVKTVNADGSTTYTTTVNFSNEKAGITRNVVVSKTKSKEGKLIKVEHSFKMTTPNFTREGTRVAVINTDGSRNVKIHTTTTWKDGRKREVIEDRVVSADGTVTGNGTVTLTAKDGTVKTFDLNLTITASGEVTTTARDDSGKTEIALDGKTDGSATAVVKEDGKETASTLNVNSAAESTPVTTPSPSPSAAAK